MIDGRLLPVAETTADSRGRFRFAGLPTDEGYVYLPGANRGGIHYPGPRVRLSPQRPQAEMTLAVYDAVSFPDPLVVRRHTIALSPEPGLLRVTETMLIDNPTAASYVGQAAADGIPPVTLQLSIPADFAEVTFAKEFFGRRFALAGGKLATSIPWPPGEREMIFSYIVPNTERQCVWRRPLDLPSTNVRVLVRRNPSGDEIAFDSGNRTLPAGHLLSVELDHLPVALMTYAPWAATAALIGLLLATCLPAFRRRSNS